MAQRYKVTKEFQELSEAEKMITLEECKRYFASQHDFVYSPLFKVTGADGTTMSIEGDFFMWSYGESQIPFRHYGGDLYVSGTNEAVVARLIEVASALRADIVEG